jgi:hypothetical protein
MKAIVRDDIVKLETFVDAEFKYKKYLEILAGCGGMCFIEQFEKHFEDDGGYYLKRKMEKAKLIDTEFFSNYKYIKLTPTAFKYLHYRYDEKDYSDIPKSKIPPAKTLPKNPTEKVFYTSMINFELYHKIKKDFFIKDKQFELLDNFFKSPINEQIDKLKEKIKYNEKLKENYAFANKAMSGNKIKSVDSILVNKHNSLKKQIEELKKETGLVGVNPTKKAQEKIEICKNEMKDIFSIYQKNRKNIDLIANLEEKSNDLPGKIKNLRDEIKKLEEELKKADEIIDKIISIRDISKLILTIENNTLHVYSAYLIYPKTSYFQIISDLLNMLKKHNKDSKFKVNIKKISFHIFSVFNSRMMYEKLKVDINTLFNKNYYSYEITGNDIKYEYTELPELRKYSDLPTKKETYLKPKDREIFNKIGDALEEDNPPHLNDIDIDEVDFGD